MNCCATSDHSFSNREKKSTVITIVVFLISAAQCTDVLSAEKPAREDKWEICIQVPNVLLFLWLIGSARCILGPMESYNLPTIDLCKIKDKS